MVVLLYFGFTEEIDKQLDLRGLVYNFPLPYIIFRSCVTCRSHTVQFYTHLCKIKYSIYRIKYHHPNYSYIFITKLENKSQTLTHLYVYWM